MFEFLDIWGRDCPFIWNDLPQLCPVLVPSWGPGVLKQRCPRLMMPHWASCPGAAAPKDGVLFHTCIKVPYGQQRGFDCYHYSVHLPLDSDLFGVALLLNLFIHCCLFKFFALILLFKTIWCHLVLGISLQSK